MQSQNFFSSSISRPCDASHLPWGGVALGLEALGCLLVRSQANRVVASVESDELRFEQDVSVDLEIGFNGLETAKTGWGCVSDWSEGNDDGRG